MIWLGVLVFVGVTATALTMTPKGMHIFGGGNNSKRPHTSGPKRLAAIKEYIISNNITSEEDLLKEGTPANKAWHWISKDDEAHMELENAAFPERYALAVYYYTTQPSQQGDNQEYSGWLTRNQWMGHTSVCRWYGIRCEIVDASNTKKVVHLNHTANRKYRNSKLRALPRRKVFLTPRMLTLRV